MAPTKRSAVPGRLRPREREPESSLVDLASESRRYLGAPDAPPLTVSLRKLTASPVRLRTKKCSMPPLSAAHKPSSTNEISRYGTLIAWAEELGHDNVLPLLNANLKEEKAADRKLNTLAKRGVNRRQRHKRCPCTAPDRGGQEHRESQDRNDEKIQASR